MKIAFVLDDSLDKTDGVQQYIITLGNWYRTRGHEVHYIVSLTKRTDIPNIHSVSKNISVSFNHNRMNTPLPANNTAIRNLLNHENFDVLHVQMPYSPLLAAKIIRLSPIKTAIFGTFHIIPYSLFESIATTALGYVVHKTKKRFDTIYSVSKPAQHFAQQWFKVQSVVLPNVVDVDKFKANKGFSGRRKPHKFTIVFLGRLVERKGCMFLLKAISKIQKETKLSNIQVIICGKGPLLAKLEQYVDEHDLSDFVRFVGYVDEDEKIAYLAGADIAVFPSTGGESFGIVLIEAMAAGSRVVLGGDNIGYESVLTEKQDQLFDPHNTKAFADLLRHYIENEAAREAAYEWQQQQLEQYDVKRVGEQLLASYQSVIAKKPTTTHNND